MRLLIQRVKRASVDVGEERVAAIGPGLLVFAGFGLEDGPDLPETKPWAATLKKILELRIFPDGRGKLNTSVQEHEGEILLVSQFTLYADCRKGRRPSFHPAAEPELASRLFDRLALDLDALYPGRVQTGSFGAEMDVSLVNWGPVTIWLSGDASGDPSGSARGERV